MGKFTFTSCIQWLLLCFLSLGTVWGQEALEVSVNRNPVRIGEQVQLTFTLKTFPPHRRPRNRRAQVALWPQYVQ